MKGEQRTQGEEWAERKLSNYGKMFKLPINNIHTAMAAETSPLSDSSRTESGEQHQHVSFHLSGYKPWAKGGGQEKGLLSLSWVIFLSTKKTVLLSTYSSLLHT